VVATLFTFVYAAYKAVCCLRVSRWSQPGPLALYQPEISRLDLRRQWIAHLLVAKANNDRATNEKGGWLREAQAWFVFALFLLVVTTIALVLTSVFTSPANGAGGQPLEINHIDVGQGNAVLIISPDGETAMIDDGRWTNCAPTVSFVTGKGINHIDYHVATHYDADHIGCLGALVDAGVSVGVCFDHGGSKNTQTFANYVGACGANRQTAYKGEVITLDAASANPVSIKVVDLNGAGVSVSPSDENALGLDMKLSYGSFSHEFGGDMPGEDPDIESVVGPEVGHVDVCTVHHHGSKYSSNDDWLNDLTPAVCVLSVGHNSYGHPTAEVLDRLHAHGVQVYWTETGSGAEPGPMDHLCNSTVTITVSLPDNYAVNCG